MSKDDESRTIDPLAELDFQVIAAELEQLADLAMGRRSAASSWRPLPPSSWPPVAAWTPDMIAEYLGCMDVDEECLEKALEDAGISLTTFDAPGVTKFSELLERTLQGQPSIVAKDVIDKAAKATASKIVDAQVVADAQKDRLKIINSIVNLLGG